MCARVDVHGVDDEQQCTAARVQLPVRGGVCKWCVCVRLHFGVRERVQYGAQRQLRRRRGREYQQPTTGTLEVSATDIILEIDNT